MAEQNISAQPSEGGIPAQSRSGAEEDRVFVASQWKLMWWRFRKHRVAGAASIVVAGFYLVAIFAEFFASSYPREAYTQLSYLEPQSIHWFDDGKFSPFVYAMSGKRDPATMLKVYTPDLETKVPVRLFVRGYEYKVLGILKTDRHLFGPTERDKMPDMFIIGADQLGRDVYSRMVYATRISMSIGLVGVFITLVLGISLGGISGYYGGFADTVIQRIIEISISIPTIPLWLGLASAVPKDWSILKVYLAITLIISLIAWTGLGRVVRGKFLALREEEFVMAARLSGASTPRIIFRHMLPSFLSHIIAATTLAIPSMILSETALSFLGLGLRAPAVSWGVLLQGAQNIQAIALFPWLMTPALAVVVAVLAFNFMGDGLRDAADPYAN